MRARLEQPGAHHRRGGQRNDQRNHHRGRQRDGKLAEQAAHLPAHEQQRNEHRHQRQADRQHRKADFARAQQRRLHAVHALLDMARGIFQHHDGVVDHEAGGHRQRHQRQVVQAEAEQVHHAEGAQQRHHGRHRRDDGRAHAAQEQADHQHHQQDRDHQRELDFVQRRADRIGAVGRDLQLDVRWQLRLQRRQQGAHAVDGFDDVGARLARDQHDHRRVAVEQAERIDVFDAVDHFGHIVQADRRAVAPGDDQVAVVGGAAPAAGAVPAANRSAGAGRLTFDRALGTVGVVGLDRGAHVFGRDAVAVQRIRQQLDPHRRQRAAADLDVAHALHLRQLLLHQVGHRFVDLAGRLGRRGQRQDDDRRVGRVGLAVGRVAAQGGRQVGARGVDRGLHFARGGVDLAVQVELQADAGRAVAAAARSSR